MLCLTRKREEAVQIGDSITIKVLEISGNRVRLGFIAPDNVRIMRVEEVDIGPQPLADILPITLRQVRQASRKAG